MYRATKNLFAVLNVRGHTTVSTTMKYHQNIDEVAAVAGHRAVRTQKGHNRWEEVQAEAAECLIRVVSAVGIEPTTY
jgi:hypothetical protein